MSMEKYSFHFRCKACNRLLNNHPRRDKEGRVRETDLCSVCTGSAYDDSPDRGYQHQQITDDFIFIDKDDLTTY